MIPLFDRLIEIDVGVITACLPAFARMLHHQLPSLQSVKSRLSQFKIITLFSSAGGSYRHSPKSQSDEKTSRKDSRLPAQYRSTSVSLHDSSLGPYVNLDGKAESTIRDDLEMGPMTVVKTFIGGRNQTDYDEDQINLKHDISQGWSSVDCHPE